MNKKIKISIRPPKMSDLKSLLSMINSLVDEKAMITMQNKPTLKQEKEYLSGLIKDKDAVSLFLMIDGKVMGNASIYKDVEEHVGRAGIALRKEARGMGLGEKLLKTVIEQGVKKI